MKLISQNTGKVGMYLRLSHEDGDAMESDSIRNQRNLLLDYIEKNPQLTLVEEYVDDGYTGSNFDRPDFQRMIADIDRQKIDCILVKDLSRFGRNYIETGRYLERIFPYLGVRFISVTDHYDSASTSESDTDQIIIPFKNLINDAYCRDISIKIRSQLAIKRKNGEFIGSFAPYGYRKDPKDHHKLIIDDYAADIVRRIFDWKIEGCSAMCIAEKLNEMQVLPPNAYKRSIEPNFNNGFKPVSIPQWRPIAIIRILQNEVYIGNLVQGKQRRINYKVKKQVDVDPKEWARVPHTHEAIIAPETFDLVQKLCKLDTKVMIGQDRVNIFSGMLRCGSCHQNMIARTVSIQGYVYHYFHCTSWARKLGCESAHLINEQKLYDAVLRSVQEQVALVGHVDELIRQADTLPKERFGVKTLRMQQEELAQQIARYRSMMDSLSRDKLANIISTDEYNEMHERFSSLLASSTQTHEMLEEKIHSILDGQRGLIPWLASMRQYRNVDHLDRRLLVSIVDYIEVFAKDKIEIHFRYADAIRELIDWASGQAVEDKQGVAI